MERDHIHPASASETTKVTRLNPGAAVDRVRDLPVPGPFEHRPEAGSIYPSEVARAFATTILVMYPVVATIAVVLVSLLLTGASHSV